MSVHDRTESIGTDLVRQIQPDVEVTVSALVRPDDADPLPPVQFV
jgi:hypothetical protein